MPNDTGIFEHENELNMFRVDVSNCIDSWDPFDIYVFAATRKDFILELGRRFRPVFRCSLPELKMEFD